VTPWLLIPVKSLHTGKSRLRAVLTDDARLALNEFFLRRMLETARRFPGRERTAVISDCESVLRIATACSVRTIPQISGPGLNRAAREGVIALRRLGAGDIALVACDVPMVRPSDLRELADPGLSEGRIVICPDKHRTGTNAILIPSGAHMEFRFGENSLSWHCRAALRAGFVARLHVNPRIAFDIDTPRDLATWISVPGRKLSAAATVVSAAPK
jgi:2-phospho-L-lactate/phosphoenolpyruvate guanylyltransferase